MRIQHNILAMNAYRNYGTNVSALSKNLEKLSSGYKINRAGDDAAGLAISEKMRAQITGLNAAQKNVKDGISLVKTAEGALQEVQDMLNRMDYLATQASNGTYDNETDRAALQKEITQLQSEINRIADSANFNGIQLLDGSMSGGEARTITTSNTIKGTLTNFDIENELPAVGSSLGVNTVLHINPSEQTTGTEFSIDLHNVGFSNKDGDKLTISLGNSKIVITGNGGKEMSAQDIIKAIVDTVKGDAKTTAPSVAFSGSAQLANGKLTIGGIEFDISSAADSTTAGTGDDRLVFTQKKAPTGADDTFDGRMTVTVEGASRTDQMSGAYAVSTGGGKAATVTISSTTDWSGWSGVSSGGNAATALTNETVTVKIDGTDYTFKIGTADDCQIKLYVDDGTQGGTEGNVYFADGTAAADADAIAAKLNELINKKIDEVNAKNLENLNKESNLSGLKYDEVPDTKDVIGHVNITAAADWSSATAITIAAGDVYTYQVSGQGIPDYNVDTTYVNNVTADDTPRLASTSFSLTADMVKEGNSIYIGGTDYNFTTEKELKDKEGYVYIGDLGPNQDGKDLTTADLIKVADRLAKAAKNNGVYTVGSDGTSAKLTFTEIEGNDGGVKNGFDLKTEEGIKKSLGFRTGNKTETSTRVIPAGENLVLQIGDTSDDYNQLKVSINDCHADAMGVVDEDGNVVAGKTIADIDISDQKGAQSAIEVIRAAINYVSDVRGTLGATQNRLDHTANNLSVMAENIQDAESTIRDTDVAEEMMSYTKNNILIQSAQAMLAQANAIPQGVLQLLG